MEGTQEKSIQNLSLISLILLKNKIDVRVFFIESRFMADNMLRQVPASSQDQKLFITRLHPILFTSVCHLSEKHGLGTVIFSWAQLSEKTHKFFCPLRRSFSKGLPPTISFHFLHFTLTLPYSNQVSSPELYFRAPAILQSIEVELATRKEMLPFLRPKCHWIECPDKFSVSLLSSNRYRSWHINLIRHWAKFLTAEAMTKPQTNNTQQQFTLYLH